MTNCTGKQSIYSLGSFDWLVDYLGPTPSLPVYQPRRVDGDHSYFFIILVNYIYFRFLGDLEHGHGVFFILVDH